MLQTKTSSRTVRLGSLATAVGLLAVLTPAGAASAAPPTTRTVGTAVLNTKAHAVVAADEGNRGRGVLDVAQFNTTRARVDTRATAVARNCRDCRAVSLAFQVVVLNGPSLDLQATNSSEATNVNCVRCETLAAAFQIVVATDHGFSLNRDELTRLAQLDRELSALAALSAHQMPLTDLAAAVQARAEEVLALLNAASERSAPEAAPSAARQQGVTGKPLPRSAPPAVSMKRHVKMNRR